MTTQKLPAAGEWWVSDSGLIAYIVGMSSTGDPVWQQSGSRQFMSDGMNWFLDCFHHEPLCTGLDWKPPSPPAIDPGDGWELLPVGTVLQDGDEYSKCGNWRKTLYPGSVSIPEWTYRRRKPPRDLLLAGF